MPNQPQTPDPPKSGAKFKAFFTGMIVAASVLVGGVAVVLWNRKTLSGLRQPAEFGKKTSPPPDVHEE
jgi:hypothetical protein